MSENHFDYFVIGAGSGGSRSARIAASHGAKVALAESSAYGGTCVNLGCIPKKIFAYGSHYSHLMKEAQAYGWHFEEARNFDWQKLREGKDALIERLSSGSKNTQIKAGVHTINGFAKFLDAYTLDVEGTQYTADHILIATGGIPRKPTFPGAEYALTSDDMFYLENLPEKAVIIGGGYVAVEFAHILRGLGVEVTLAYRKELFLRSFDRDLAQTLAEEMQKQGINLHFNCDVESIEKNGKTLIFNGTENVKEECDLVLAAIGRDANTANLDLEKAGVTKSEDGKIPVNEYYQTNIPHIYAIGDIMNDFNLTPVAIQEGHVLSDRIFGRMNHRYVDYNNIPTAIFSSPPIGTIGLSEEAAREQGLDVEIYRSKFRPLKHTITGFDEKTLVKLVVDKKTDKVLGLHMIGADSPEIIQGFAVAMNAGATKADLDRTIAVHPSAAEEFVTMRTPVE